MDLKKLFSRKAATVFEKTNKRNAKKRYNKFEELIISITSPKLIFENIRYKIPAVMAVFRVSFIYFLIFTCADVSDLIWFLFLRFEIGSYHQLCNNTNSN